MVKAYLVARAVRVTFAFMARAGVPVTKESTWHAPVLDKDAKMFTSKASATSYCNMKNDELKHPKKDKNGNIMLNIAPYDDFHIFPIERA